MTLRQGLILKAAMVQHIRSDSIMLRRQWEYPLQAVILPGVRGMLYK